MDILTYKSQLQENVIAPMTEFMNECEDCGFTEEDVAKCEALLLEYFSALEDMVTPSNREIMHCVMNLVLALNQLNEDTDYCMIETMEREAICELIQESALAFGLTDAEDDITEEWREW